MPCFRRTHPATLPIPPLALRVARVAHRWRDFAPTTSAAATQTCHPERSRATHFLRSRSEGSQPSPLHNRIRHRSHLRQTSHVTHWPTNPTQPRAPTAKNAHITLRLGGEPTR